jgi:hypothetical protein
MKHNNRGKQLFGQIIVGIIFMAVLWLIMWLTGNLPTKEGP